MILNLLDLEASARERLPESSYDYYAGGAHGEVTLGENRRAYDELALRPRVMVDVGRRDLSTTVVGHRLAAPVLVAPMAFQRLAHPDGELATTRAAHAAGSVMILSTLATASLEEVRAASAGPLWFQLYVYKDRGATRALVERAERAGCAALVLTVDAPLLGRRERDVRSRFTLPPGLAIGNVVPGGPSTLPPPASADSGLAAYFAGLLDAGLTWRDVEWLRSVTRLPVLVKGVLRGDDAVRAVEHGAAAVVVSNHGGRQLDTAVATIRALPEVVDAVAGRAEVLVDGGVRRGTDVLKALALGARAVLLGRPVLWGLASGGEAGVASALAMLRDELDLAMALCGCPTVGSVTGDLIAAMRR
jgi:4-hydroxymandelate oxidase